MRRVTVDVEPAYDVVIGPEALDALGTLIEPYRRAVIVSQQTILDALHDRVTVLDAVRPDPWIVTMGDGEAAKSLTTIGALCGEFARGGLLRGDLVVALGGGVVGDTVGLAAAVYHRGVALVQVPTTLLAQVDASVGGKTAVNLAEGKNLVGAFHQPIGVVTDTTLVASLPEAEFRGGLGEVAKYALLPQGERVIDMLRLDATAVLQRDPEALTELVAECVTIKAAIVAADPHELHGGRAVLNYGHTFAHALETSGGYDLAHGEAVAIGLVFAVHVAQALERVGPDAVDRVHGVVAGLGLPVQVPGDADRADLLATMRRDKKARGGITFVLPGARGVEIVHDVPDRALDAGFAAVGA